MTEMLEAPQKSTAFQDTVVFIRGPVMVKAACQACRYQRDDNMIALGVVLTLE